MSDEEPTEPTPEERATRVTIAWAAEADLDAIEVMIASEIRTAVEAAEKRKDEEIARLVRENGRLDGKRVNLIADLAAKEAGLAEYRNGLNQKDEEIARLKKDHHSGAWHECPDCTRYFRQDVEGAELNANLERESAALRAQVEAQKEAGREYIARTDPLISCGAWLHGGEVGPRCGDCRGCLRAQVEALINALGVPDATKLPNAVGWAEAMIRALAVENGRHQERVEELTKERDEWRHRAESAAAKALQGWQDAKAADIEASDLRARVEKLEVALRDGGSVLRSCG